MIQFGTNFGSNFSLPNTNNNIFHGEMPITFDQFKQQLGHSFFDILKAASPEIANQVLSWVVKNVDKEFCRNVSIIASNDSTIEAANSLIEKEKNLIKEIAYVILLKVKTESARMCASQSNNERSTGEKMKMGLNCVKRMADDLAAENSVLRAQVQETLSIIPQYKRIQETFFSSIKELSLNFFGTVILPEVLMSSFASLADRLPMHEFDFALPVSSTSSSSTTQAPTSTSQSTPFNFQFEPPFTSTASTSQTHESTSQTDEKAIPNLEFRFENSQTSSDSQQGTKIRRTEESEHKTQTRNTTQSDESTGTELKHKKSQKDITHHNP